MLDCSSKDFPIGFGSSRKSAPYDKNQGHEFTSGRQRNETRSIIIVVHMFKGIYCLNFLITIRGREDIHKPDVAIVIG